MKTVRYIVTFVLLAVLAATVLAGVDDQGNPNDPAENDRANACYEGGTLEFKCGTTDSDGDGVVSEFEIEWHWNCGWYLIRFEAGMFTESDAPDQCKAFLDDIGEDDDGDDDNEPACDLIDDTTRGAPSNDAREEIVLSLNTFDPTGNDCDPIAPIEVVSTSAVSNVASVSNAGNDVLVECQTAGPDYKINVVYADQTGRTATILVSGECQFVVN